MNFIKNISLPKIAKRHPVAFSSAIILHIILLFGILFSNIQSVKKIDKVKKTTTKPKYISKVVAVNLSEFKKEKQRITDIKKKKDLRLKREEKHLKTLEDKRYQEQRKINEIKAKTKKAKQAKKIAEQQKKAAEKKKKAAEKAAKAAEKAAKAAEKKTKEAEKAAKAAEKKTKAAEEAGKEAKLERKKDAEEVKKLKAESEKLEEDKRKVINELKENYKKIIQFRVKGQWRYLDAKDDWGCDVNILQDEGGKVLNVELKSCNIDDKRKEKSFKNSIIRAVNKASPLPAAPNKSIFDREIIFHFKAN